MLRRFAPTAKLLFGSQRRIVLGKLIKKPYHKLKNSPRVRGINRRVVGFREKVLYGGRFREALLVRLLGGLHRSQFRRDWVLYSKEPPHFYNQRWNGFEFTYGKSRSAYCFLRGFLASEVIRDGDHLLDIGCGDGFFSNSFFSQRCRHIDAIDIDESAIEAAKNLNSSPVIDYFILDAVREPFPSERYDVIVWDGAIGHFSQSDLSTVLEKVRGAISPSGIFVGSESLGIEGTDHLQYFEDAAALSSVFKPYFEHVLVRTAEYQTGGGFPRTEAYWRCTNDTSSRHESTVWTEYAGPATSANAS
jgi:2-polyprenyl-3-methyl-5-hydroxy-6-metoxy-1,4-benzoquinol methylase